MGMLCLIAMTMYGQASSDVQQQVDFANGENRELWVRHPVWGDPSFDTFERLPGNPVHRGTPPYDWPVNGFLFQDPPSGDWYLYVGNYLTGYGRHDVHPSMCTVFRSRDRGKTWEFLGSIFAEDEEHFFEGEVSPQFSYPDISVVYEEGIYHLVYDWSTKNFTWEGAHDPLPDSNSGAAYAWSDRPEGPYQRTNIPVVTTRNQEALAGKYRRMYASSLIRRENDWLVLTLTDSGPYFGWALTALTSENPEGPYSKAHLVLHPESDQYHPPLLEFFPAFTHEEYVYMPSTSVAINRNYQGMFLALIEEAHRPEAWELIQRGSVWHADPTENEAHGLWGQTFSGFIDDEGFFNVMFPSRDPEGQGTINLARRPWNKPYREQGFVASGHRGATLVRTKYAGTPSEIAVSMRYTGTVALLWDMQGPMGANRPSSDATLHPLMLREYRYLELDAEQWHLMSVDASGTYVNIAAGQLDNENNAIEIKIIWQDGDATLHINDEAVWNGSLEAGTGALGMYLDTFSHAEVTSFSVQGSLQPATMTQLYTEALLGAAQGFVYWDRVEDDQFRFGEGAISKPGSAAAAKWNFEGNAFTLWAPSGPEYGKAAVYLNGDLIDTVDFYADQIIQSKPILQRADLELSLNALTLKPVEGTSIPLDCLEVR